MESLMIELIIMSRRVTITLIVNLLLALSSYFLILLISRSDQENDPTSKLRLTFLLGVHVIVFLWMIIIVTVEKLFNIVLTIFVFLFIISVSLYVCEIKVHQITLNPSYHFNHYANHLEKMELTYLNIYFLVYMYSLIGLIPSGVFLVATQGLMCWQEHLINKYKDRCLKKVGFQESLKHQMCSICLGQFLEQSNDGLIKINNCGHIYHEKCLCEWLRYKTKCPMDRCEIFAFQEAQEEA